MNHDISLISALVASVDLASDEALAGLHAMLSDASSREWKRSVHYLDNPEPGAYQYHSKRGQALLDAAAYVQQQIDAREDIAANAER